MPKVDLIAGSGLPPEIQKLLRQVIGRAGLWKRERESLTLELLAHFADGLEAGRSAENLIKTFGDPKLAAKLMRRGKKRNRPLWWRAGRRVVQGVGVFFLLYLGQMAFLLTGRPEPKIDYAARLCAEADAVPEADRAWPIYREAWLKDDPSKIDWTPSKIEQKPSTQPVISAYEAVTLPATDPRRLARSAAIEADRLAARPLSDVRPGDPTWDQAVALLQKHSALLEAARAGGMKPGLGITIRERRGLEGREYRALFPVKAGDPGRLPIIDRTFDCRENGAIWSMVKLLAMDMRWAASQGDGGRAAQDYRCIVGMCRQAQESASLLGQAMSIMGIRRGDAALSEVMMLYPSLFSSQQFVELLGTMPTARDAVAMTLESARAEMRDLIQRSYSDDGSGGGKLTRAGAELLLSGRETERQSVASALALPLLSVCAASRREMEEAAQELYGRMEKDMRQPLREALATPVGPSPMVEKMTTSLLARVHYWPMCILVLQVGNMAKELHIAHAQHDGLTVALALEAYRRENGAYSANLEVLVPRYLAAIPLDPLANRPLLYALHEGKPVIYACGQDGKDHGGVVPEKRPFDVPKGTDWILFPPAP